MSKDVYKGMFKKKSDEVEDKVLGGVDAAIREQVEKVEERILSGVEPAIENIVTRFKKLQEITGVGIAEIEIGLEAQGKIGNLIGFLASVDGKLEIKIKLQPK